jgi:uncharacterized membrane protein YgcG
MKRGLIIGLLIFFCTTGAWADTVDQQLPKTASEQVKNSTRQLLDQGFNAENAIDMTRQMLANNFNQQQVLQAHAILMDAQKQGLQTEPIMNKAYEGLAKQVQAEAIVQAMVQVRSRYAFATMQAKDITNNRVRVQQMATILAGSMAAGMTPEDANRIMQTLQERIRNMTRAQAEELALQTFMTTRTMTRFGMQSMSVGDSICQALQQGYSAQEMQNMRNTVMANSQHSFSESHSSGHGFNGGQHAGDSSGGKGGSSGGGGGKGGGHM